MLRPLVLALAAALLLPAPAAVAAPAKRPIAYASWAGDALGAGTYDGTRLDTDSQPATLLADTATGHRRFAGRRYETSAWTSPWTAPGFGLTQLIASWDATTPGSSWIEVQVRGRSADGHRASWDVLGRWAAGDRFVQRATVSGQSDDLAAVDVDTWKASTPLTSWQVRVLLMRVAGHRSPRVTSVGAVASALPTTTPPTSKPTGLAAGVRLAVPRYSQMAHSGDYPQWDGGGEAWCSPTSTSMVLGYYDALPDPASYAWVPDGHVDPWVDYAARMTWDDAYEGTGNWPFNAAYAATQLGRTGRAFVTRLHSLRDAERFIAAGIPLVASISFSSGELDGAPISSTNGHLLVIAGFTKAGDVVVNDPASPTRKGVRRTYDRAQLEHAWLGGSGGLVYVITDDDHPLPTGTGAW